MNNSPNQNISELPIAIFDSGIGGLSVLREAIHLLPNENYIYFADKENVPYGTKTKDEVNFWVLKAADFLNSQKIKMLVVACNTATSIAINDLRNKFDFPVVGMEPAVKPAVSNNKNKRVLVLATELTLKEKKFRELVDKVDNEKIVDFLPLPELVEFAEKFVFNDDIVVPVLKEKLSLFELGNYGTVVLGCTHFPFYKDMLKKIFPAGTEIIDGNLGTVRHAKNILDQLRIRNQQLSNGHIVFYHSGQLVTNSEIISRYRSLSGK